ncbi:cytochrome P450- family 724- subfamily A-polypeptide 1 [Striga hermonthica]|uniref:Cytochrome P450 724B1 n=1 Tax=Striga hermonthica TaxID=68872 RepID=A0A9N7N8T2_STRHE|nr:cytochrome P450- family 724- subfamily A-polypeptide 1 [Striga hermonthica]
MAAAAAFLPMALAFLLGLFTAICCKFFKVSIFRQKPATVLTTPNGSIFFYLPLLGETLSFLKPHNSNSPGTFLQQHCSRYGRVFKSHLFGRPTIVSCDHDFNMFILQNEERLFRSSYPKPIHDILGKHSMMLVSGDLHKKLRSVAVGFINGSKSRPDFLDYVDKLCVSLVESWKAKNQVLFFKEAKELTFYIMLKNLVSIEPEDPPAANILEDFLTFMEGFVSLPLYIPGTAYSKAINARRRISNTLHEIIKKRENTFTGKKTLRRGDFLDEILSNGGLNYEEKVISVLLDLLLAGYETTSGLMALVVYFLAQAPLALQTLQNEHKVLRKRKKEGEPLNWDDYKNMEFTSHVLNEALRCGNLVKFVHRKALEDVKFKGYVIPEGWQVLPIILGAHLDPTLHQNPSEFNPWRWIDPTTSRKVSPYGGGLRICPGAELGKLETAFFLHHLVLNFRWKTSEEDCPISRPYLEFKRGLLLEIEQID